MKQHLLASVRVYLVLTVLLGLMYPLGIWAVGRVFFRNAADGSFVPRGGKIVGSELIAQSFAKPELFHPRASAAGEKGFDAMSSSGTNLGPTSKKLADSVKGAVDAARAENPGAGPTVPADMVTTSASGLDPHISPENARWQLSRVAKASGIPVADLEAMIARRTEGRFLGLFGEPRVNVLLLNIDVLDRARNP
jgi:K+-transporting ATPase ATPase C chain